MGVVLTLDKTLRKIADELWALGKDAARSEDAHPLSPDDASMLKGFSSALHSVASRVEKSIPPPKPKLQQDAVPEAPPHPMQPVVSIGGVHRFKMNTIVRYLLDEGTLDLNGITKLVSTGTFTREDFEQFMQLIGYSASGIQGFDFVSDRVCKFAREESAALVRKEREHDEKVRSAARRSEFEVFKIGNTPLHAAAKHTLEMLVEQVRDRVLEDCAGECDAQAEALEESLRGIPQDDSWRLGRAKFSMLNSMAEHFRSKLGRSLR